MSKIRWHLHWSKSAWYGFCPDESAWEVERARALKKGVIDIRDYPVTTGMTTCYRTPDPRALLTLHDELDGDPIRLVGTLSHEAFHIAKMIFDQMAESDPGEEVWAYTIGDITSTLFRDYSLTRGRKLKELTGE